MKFIAAEGSALCFAGTDKLELPQGYGLFVNSSILHRYEASGRTFIPNIVFSPALLAPEKSLIYEKYVRPVINSSAAYQLLNPQIEWQNKALQILAAVFRIQENEYSNELQTVRFLLDVWDLLYEHLDLTCKAPDVHRKADKQARLQIMMKYIHDHYQEQISLAEIAAAVSISKSTALQIFQESIDSAPVSYLIRYRLMRAAELLCTTEKSVSAIAEETGFSSAGYFCRKFKQRYQSSPNEYRRKRN